MVEPFVHADDDGWAGGGGEGVATNEPGVGEEETGRQRGGGETQEKGGGGAQTQVQRGEVEAQEEGGGGAQTQVQRGEGTGGGRRSADTGM